MPDDAAQPLGSSRRSDAPGAPRRDPSALARSRRRAQGVLAHPRALHSRSLAAAARGGRPRPGRGKAMSEFARFYAAQRAAKLCACRWEEKPGARITPRPAADLAKAKEALLFAVEESFAAMTHPLLPGWRPLADAEKAGR